jgi:hypothetical protein
MIKNHIVTIHLKKEKKKDKSKDNEEERVILEVFVYDPHLDIESNRLYLDYYKTLSTYHISVPPYCSH